MSLDLLQDDVVGSAYNAAYYIKHVMKLPEDKKIFVVGDKGLEDELNDMGVKFVGGHQVNRMACRSWATAIDLMTR